MYQRICTCPHTQKNKHTHVHACVHLHTPWADQLKPALPQVAKHIYAKEETYTYARMHAPAHALCRSTQARLVPSRHTHPSAESCSCTAHPNAWSRSTRIVSLHLCPPRSQPASFCACDDPLWLRLRGPKLHACEWKYGYVCEGLRTGMCGRKKGMRDRMKTKKARVLECWYRYVWRTHAGIGMCEGMRKRRSHRRLVLAMIQCAYRATGHNVCRVRGFKNKRIDLYARACPPTALMQTYCHSHNNWGSVSEFSTVFH